VLCAVGDLIEDVVVQLRGDLQRDTDTPATIVRRRGGSAANVAYFAAKLTGRSRFVGCIGVDPLGDSLADQLTRHAVEVCGERRGRTGSIVVVATTDGVRTMLTDRGSATELASIDPRWLNDVTTLHLPLYSFSHEPISSAVHAMVREARVRDIEVSVDLSSVALINELGVTAVQDLLATLVPDVLFCTRAEADAVGVGPSSRHGARLVVVKDGADPVVVFGDSVAETSYPVPVVSGVVDGTGAGDAFAAAFLASTPSEEYEADNVASRVASGQSLAGRVVTLPGATLEGS
jgi:sugar/nucleoside kinase (ribokinase family)